VAAVAAVAEEVELGWRLGREHWGHGYATEGAAKAVRWAFDERGLERLISIIDSGNERSLRVAAKLGFTYWRDVDHPRWPDPLKVYALERAGA
jgi:RimJ/RimL family protein N-acetyltransferase